MNYIMHNKELDGTLYKPESPVIFTKADSSLLKDKKPFFIPDDLGQIDYETELVVRICRLGKSIPQRFAHRYYDAVSHQFFYLWHNFLLLHDGLTAFVFLFRCFP